MAATREAHRLARPLPARVWRRRAVGPPGRSLFLFAVPSLLVLSLVLVFPLGYALYLSLFDYYLANPDRTFIGLGNYAELLSERRFWWSMLNTLIIAGTAVATEFVLGFALALCLFRLTWSPKTFMVLNFLPHIITPVVAALFLRWIFVSRWGLLDATLAIAQHLSARLAGRPLDGEGHRDRRRRLEVHALHDARALCRPAEHGQEPARGGRDRRRRAGA